MSEGQICASGSPMFLKKAFNTGYHLRVSKAPQGFREEEMERFLQANLSRTCRLGQSATAEALYEIPRDSAPKLGQFFNLLDKNLSRLRITSYGLTCTSMDDVFQATDKIFKRKSSSELNAVLEPMPKGVNFSQQQSGQLWRGLIAKVSLNEEKKNN